VTGRGSAGDADDLATEAVRGVRFDVVPLVPGPPPSLARTFVAQYDRDYPRLVSEWLTAQTFDLARAQASEGECRERNTAMLLWGIHL
jgi:hypothetical protein